jgi:pimeloyl-ACP methyl ester carboxylesterase
MPDRVVAIVPVDTLQNVEAKVPQDQLDAVFKQMEADYKNATTSLLNQYFFSATTPAAVKERVINATLSRQPEIAIPMLKAVFSYDPTAAMRELKVPIRAINADRVPTDLAVNRKYAPQFDVVIIKGTGHYPMLEDPARFNQMLAEILRNLPRM